MYRYYPLIVLLAFTFSLPAQTYFQREKRDYVWVLGFGTSFGNPNFGGENIDFNNIPPVVVLDERSMNFEAANASICDADGNLLFYTNGIYVANYLHETMENGDQLYSGPFAQEWSQDGVRYPQTLLAIPEPNNPNKYFLFCLPVDTIADANNFYGYRVLSLNLNVNHISMEENNGEGIVTEKNIVLISDTLDNGKLTAVRHANGRDWWVVVPENDTNGFYRMLVTPDTILNCGLQIIGDTIPSGLGQAAFSPDGTKYARLNLYHLGQDQYIDIYDFDRCTGTFSNPVQFTYRDTALMGGLAFSENSRFLYVSSFSYLYQYDLQSEDIPSSKVTIGFPEPSGEGYFLSQLAPDGKIYVGTQGSTFNLHLIHSPNKRAPACNFEFIGFPLPKRNFRTIPNFPYYGLGPMDGSACDTLGIDNPPPTAAFEYTADTTALTVAFFDGSFFADEWYWDFGDGTTSTARHPEHSFAQAGPHEVCLTVSNVSGSDTHCEVVMLGTVATQEVEQAGVQVKVYPNPASDYFLISGEPYLSGQLEVRDLYGRIRKTQLLGNQASHRVGTTDLESGMYIVTVKLTDGARYNIRLLIAK